MALAFRNQKRNKDPVFFMDNAIFPQTKAVVMTRAKNLGVRKGPPFILISAILVPTWGFEAGIGWGAMSKFRARRDSVSFILIIAMCFPRQARGPARNGMYVRVSTFGIPFRNRSGSNCRGFGQYFSFRWRQY
eukprot:sb/3474925/